MNSLYRIGAGFSPAERLAVARTSLARLSAAGWETAEEIDPRELAADPEAVVAMGIIAAQAPRNMAPIAGVAAELAPVAMEALGGYLRRKNERKEERRNRSRGSDSGESRVYLPAFPPPPPPKPNNTKWFILGGIGLALVLVLFLFLRK